jgi:cleavage stimulation factor subunit 2
LAFVVPQHQPQQQQQQQQKNDIFVGNLAFNTSEEQLHQAFSEVGRVIKVRMVTDNETGKPRGFAFIEFEEPEAALSAIRNMNEYELNGRRLRVNFSNSSHLEDLADKLGMDLSQQTQRQSSSQNNNQAGPGTTAVADALKALSKAEMYDIVAKFKEIADRDPDEARRLLSGHPQLPEAMLFIMSKLDMVQTPVTTDGGAAGMTAAPGGVVPPPMMAPPSRAADPRARVDPRAAAAAAPVDPRAAAARADPRTRVDPRAARAAAAAPPPPPMMARPPPQQQYGAPPPPPPMAPNTSALDPALVQQVMSLTPQQIAQLPPDKQQSILALRQQITGGR